MKCREYVGAACVDGRCPIANLEEYEEIGVPVASVCQNCIFSQSCLDCVLYKTRWCSHPDKVEVSIEINGVEVNHSGKTDKETVAKTVTNTYNKVDEQMEENLNTYSVIITYCANGGTRGYTVKAENRSVAFGKLMQHINFDYVAKVEIAEIVVNMDNIE